MNCPEDGAAMENGRFVRGVESGTEAAERDFDALASPLLCDEEDDDEEDLLFF